MTKTALSLGLCSNVKFTFQRVIPSGARLPRTYPRAFYGAPVDDRGRCSVQLVQGASDSAHQVSYDPEKFVLRVGDETIRATNAESFRKRFPADRLLVDATTLDVPELLLLARIYGGGAAHHLGFLYVEPEGYREGKNPSDVHGFDLSSGYRPFSPIPGFTPELSAQRQGRMLAFLGFEPGRLNRVLSPDEVAHIKAYSVAFGVPPFQASWEMHALAKNAEALNQGIVESVLFAGANNAMAAYDLICEVAKTVDVERERLVLAPLGTKPAGVGVALYAATHDSVRVMFDFPERQPERTHGVSRVHHIGISMR
jgi:hypothetical protein